MSMWVVYPTCVCVSKNSIVSKDVVFHLFCCNVIPWSSHTRKKSSLSFHSSSVKFSEYHRGSVRVKLTKCAKLNGVKHAIMQVAYFLDGPMFNLLFFCHIVSYWEKVTVISYEKYSYNLTLEVQIVWKVSAF